MDHYLAAIGRDVGKVDTDSGGLARYSLKLQLPPGIGHGNEPELSLEYCQGCPNGSLGLGWALGGLSCIRRAPSNLAHDGSNTPPADYDRSKPKLALDGTELLNIKGAYDEQDAEYTTEIDTLGRRVSHLETGFLVRDSTGIRKEYGTTDDSRVKGPDGTEVREWRLKKQIDCHSNAVTYTYVVSPQGSGAGADINTCYLSEVRYSSNENTGHQATRIARLEYTSREDVVVQTVQGQKALWASLLAAVRIGIIRGDSVEINRSYELSYTRSQFTGDSCLTSVTETAGTGDGKLELLPSKFGYTTPGVSPQALFKTVPQKVTSLRNTTNNVALLTLNISGRSLADVACVRYNPASKSMSIKTYLAVREPDGKVGWAASDGPGAEATLPVIDIAHGFPGILAPDLSGDGRSDLIVPFSDNNGMVRFSISQSIGTGFQNHRTKDTPFKWTDGSRFMAVDLTGYGTTDVVQIFTEQRKLAFRNFPSVTQQGVLGLRDAKLTRTTYDNVGTIDWFLLTNAKTGAMSLVRVWAQDQGKGIRRINATAFAAANSTDSGAGFKEGPTSILEKSVQADRAKYHVVACDINGDGTQDIVLATAVHRNGRMALAYTTFLGDGQGGFEKHQATITREIAAPTPLNSPEHGNFHTTNLNGSNYPSVSFVYQERNAKSYICLSVDGRSDGLVGEAVLYRLAGDMPSSNMEVVPVDLNGNGMGDWLFHTIENDQPRMVPIYNNAEVTDFLSWASDPMGLVTTVSYGALSDPAVYTPSVSWKNYQNESKDSYAVLGAPNYVVTALDHSNDSSINSFDYKVSVKKSYSSAIVSTKGRGWQGFGAINSLNTTDNILTTEKYFQAWPLTSQKSRVETKTPDGKVFKSEATSYESVSVSRGPWKIYRANKTFERTDMWEDNVVARSNATTFECDEYGNVVAQSSSETVRDQLVSSSWQRCTYTAINGIKGLLTSKKISSKQDNTDMSKFEGGDASLSLFEYSPETATLKSISEWSTDVNDFAVKTFTFDGQGNEIQTIDAAGLKTTTTYDDFFKSFLVKTTTEGPGISTLNLAAFDEASGQESARLGEDGSLKCYRIDPFGRIIETRLRSSGQGGSRVTTTDFFVNRPHVADASFSTMLSGLHLDPFRELTFERHKTASGAAHVGTKVFTYSKEGVDGRSEVAELMDCARQVRKRYSRHGDVPSKTWMSWDYDSCGHHTFETLPTKAPASSDLDWVPDRSIGITASFDILGRMTAQVRPAHSAENSVLIFTTTYLDGGAKVREQTFSAPNAETPLDKATQLLLAEKRYARIGQEEHITEILDENGLRSTFQYDVAGNMILATDPAGNVENRTYNSKGQLVTLDNPYQNVDSAAASAYTYKYNLAGHIISEANAAGEVITFERDAKGRVLQKVGQDGRTVVYVYDAEVTDKPSAITVHPQGSSAPLETQFGFTYDHQGRPKERTLTIADGTRFATSLSYDWQGEAVRKVFSDGTVSVNEYRGALLKSSTLSGGSASTWQLKADHEEYTATEKPEKIIVQGSGMKEPFEHDWSYDPQGFVLSHSLHSGSSSLVQNHYMYNAVGMMVRRHEFMSGSTTDYSYLGRRLQSSQSGDGVKNYYEHDTAGNLTQKGGVAIAYSPGRAIGTENNASVFDVSYDASGRMVKRATEQSTFGFTYDSFGWLKSYADEASGTSVEITTDFSGETLQRRHSDGSSEIMVDDDFTIHTQADGSRIVRHKLFGKECLLGTVSNTYESATSTRPLGGGRRSVDVAYTDTNGNVTHIYNGLDSSDLREKLDYDDYGSLATDTPDIDEKDRTATYEGKRLDETTGLLDFGGRWYDPLVGRFTTPDDILEMELLIRTDGLNRYAFENNDPINHIDPTGHWTWSAIAGVALGAVLVVGAIALTVATAGATTVLAAALVGALASGGVAGIIYSCDNNSEDGGKFWGGFATTVAFNAAIGAAAGALGAVAAPARAVSATGRLAAKVGLNLTDKAVSLIGMALSVGGKSLLGGTVSVLGKATERGVQNAFYGTQHDLFEGALSTFAAGAVVGAAVGAAGLYGSTPPVKLDKVFKLTSAAATAVTSTNPLAMPGITTQVLKATAAKTGSLVWYGYKKLTA